MTFRLWRCFFSFLQCSDLQNKICLPQSSPCSVQSGSPEVFKLDLDQKTSLESQLTKNLISSSLNFGFGVKLNLREMRLIRLGFLSFFCSIFFFQDDDGTSLFQAEMHVVRNLKMQRTQQAHALMTIQPTKAADREWTKIA